jgi:PilZ domain
MTNGNSSDRRRWTRYTCDGTAEVQAALGSLRFRGKILDLSLTGCYLETAPPVRLERGSHVEIFFRLNGLAFRVAATLTAMRPGLGTGFSFSRPSPRTQRQLEMLIEELNHALQQTASTRLQSEP